MGCDIHCFVEKKVGSSWELHESDVDVWRNYRLFGALANVRHEYPGLSKEPRGFPGDASTKVKHEHESWGVDAHSASYATLEELELLTLASVLHAEATEHGVPGSLRDFIKDIFPENAEPDAYRVVFWFDN